MILFISHRDKLKSSDKVCLDCDRPNRKGKLKEKITTIEKEEKPAESGQIVVPNSKRTVFIMKK